MTVNEMPYASGRVFWDGEFRDGTILCQKDKIIFEEGKVGSGSSGTILPVPVNAHTHIGDTFVATEPTGDLPSVVGPGGFKERQLANANSELVKRGMRRAMEYMKLISSPVFIDFRESGSTGVKLLRESVPESVFPIILSRGHNREEVELALSISDGTGISAESDADHDLVSFSARTARKLGKIFSIHASENAREDMDFILSLKPDFLVHCLEASEDDLESISRLGIGVAVTPRSNYFYGKRPDYSKFIDHGIDLMLGTDNSMIALPDIYAEMDFLYTVQKGINRISPENIVRMVFHNPHKRLGNFLGQLNNLFLYFPKVALSSYEIVKKSSLYEKKVIRIQAAEKMH